MQSKNVSGNGPNHTLGKNVSKEKTVGDQSKGSGSTSSKPPLIKKNQSSQSSMKGNDVQSRNSPPRQEYRAKNAANANVIPVQNPFSVLDRVGVEVQDMNYDATGEYGLDTFQKKEILKFANPNNLPTREVFEVWGRQECGLFAHQCLLNGMEKYVTLYDVESEDDAAADLMKEDDIVEVQNPKGPSTSNEVFPNV